MNTQEMCGVLHSAYAECVDRHGERHCKNILKGDRKLFNAYSQCAFPSPVSLTREEPRVRHTVLRVSHH